ncbi:poly-gamma-glutamate capsule biosynthesis protein CapA/YwtB (metallophosphatase superfamily) [Staphylococcus hominis]
MYRYYITSVVIFLVFSLICGMALAEDNSEKLSVVAVGDNLIHPVVYNDAQRSDGSFNFKPMYSNIKNDITTPDLAFVNQESPLGGDDIPFSGFKQFNTPSQVASDIVATGFDMINGANNHSLDQGDQGVTNHIQTWEKFDHNVLFTGIYNSKKEANRVHTISKNGVKISVLSYTYGTNDMVSNDPYTVKTFDEATINRIYEKQNNKAT